MFRSAFPLVAAFVALVSVLAVQPASAQTTPGPRAATAKAPVGTVATIVNLNTASASDLEGLPGIGAKTAARIVEYRQKNGPFKKVEELMNVRGIGEKNFLKLKPQISVTPGKADHD
jgi:competence protein ComEA